jgi:hypothetical protein
VARGFWAKDSRRYTVQASDGAVLHLFGSRHAEAATAVWCQIAKASASNAIATLGFTGTSPASS